MKIELAHRIRELPPYLFAKIDALKNEERKKGRDLIDLGIGDPDLPTPAHIVEALASENGFLPDLDAIPADVARRAKILWINYPNNPTAALAAPGFYEKVVAFAQKNDVIVASDLAYSEMYYESPPPSFLQTPGAMEVGIEFHSLSKTYNMTGWRVGWACGNEKLVAGLGQVKTNVDSGCFDAIQYAAIAALTGDQAAVAAQREIYRERRDVPYER